ncbi:MAG: hypothetical protein ACFFDH_13510 [Promethearchaeota archaeon]
MYSPINNPRNNKPNGLREWYEVKADIYNNTSETWSDEITRKWFPTLKEARSYYLYHPNKIANRLYSNFKIYRCVKGEDPPPKNGLQRHAGIIQEQVL